MSDPDTLPIDVHPEAALLPWYATGTLGDTERRQVAKHLETCAACRGELEELKGLKADLTALYAAQPGPSSKTAESILHAVARDVEAQRETRASYESWIERIDQWLRSLFLPRWVPTLVVTILLAQIGLVMWSTLPTPRSERITARSLDLQTSRLTVAFQGTATEDQIRSVLGSVHGRIVDGPTTNGLYTIEILAQDAETRRITLERLRGRADIIRSADIETP